MNIPYPGKQRFLAIPSSYCTLSPQNQSLKLNTKKELQKERNKKKMENINSLIEQIFKCSFFLINSVLWKISNVYKNRIAQ